MLIPHPGWPSSHTPLHNLHIHCQGHQNSVNGKTLATHKAHSPSTGASILFLVPLIPVIHLHGDHFRMNFIEPGVVQHAGSLRRRLSLFAELGVMAMQMVSSMSSLMTHWEGVSLWSTRPERTSMVSLGGEEGIVFGGARGQSKMECREFHIYFKLKSPLSFLMLDRSHVVSC